ncbi:MAG: methyltransferase domain-containing protein [Solirubrobacteraceae bacterium]
MNSALADAALRQAFTTGGRLPEGYGAGFNERVVEYPWALTRLSGDDVLDAGSTFNHAALLDRFSGKNLTIATLAPEPRSFVERRISYIYADLRALPFRDDAFDQVLCVSVLEHIGMDNRGYGADAPAASHPRAEARRALVELTRVVRPGGRINLTVPYGTRTEMGWFRQFDQEDVNELLAGVTAESIDVSVYRRDDSGWQLTTLEAASGAAYADGAYAVACLEVWL